MTGEVSKDAFFASVGQLDVHPHILPGLYPYTEEWKNRHGMVLGKTVSKRCNGEVLTSYYVIDRQSPQVEEAP